MNFLENVKLKKEIKNIEPLKNAMYEKWNNLIQIYNAGLQEHNTLELRDESSYSQWNNMYQNINGQVYRIGASKATTYNSNNQVPEYEFMLVKTLPDGQVDSNFYQMTASGNFTNTRGLASMQIQYLAKYNNTDIPCTATLNINAGDLLNNMQGLHINPIVKPSIDSIPANECNPDFNDLYSIISEFCRLNNLNQNMNKNESVSDFIAGR